MRFIALLLSRALLLVGCGPAGVKALGAVQYPGRIGKRTIEIVAAHLCGETVPVLVPVAEAIIDQATLKAEQ